MAEGSDPTSSTRVKMDAECQNMGSSNTTGAEGSDPTSSTRVKMDAECQNMGSSNTTGAEGSDPTSSTRMKMDAECQNMGSSNTTGAEGSDPTSSTRVKMDAGCQNTGSSNTTMAEGSDPTSSTRVKMDADSTLTEFFTNCDDYLLFRLTKFYRDRLEQAIEEWVEGLALMLIGEHHFSGQEYQVVGIQEAAVLIKGGSFYPNLSAQSDSRYLSSNAISSIWRKVSELVQNGNRAGSSKLLLNLVMGKGSRARRMMWESFVKMHHSLRKLGTILREIQELGSDPINYMKVGEELSEIPSHLKDVQQKHKETLRVQTETLRVNTILIKEKVKIFQLVDRYAELTVISTVRDRTLVEHELLARGRDHEEWREKHLRRELEKIRTDQLFQSSFSPRKSKSGNSAAVSGVPGIGKTTMVQKIVYDWATGKIYPHFQFVFSFKFRDLNTINCRINLRNLILDQNVDEQNNKVVD
ncbi:uncharacterized protein LOC144484914 [Mustelus asterias]